MLAASDVNKLRGVSTTIFGILQDQDGAVAFRLEAEHSAPAAASAGSATQLDVPSRSANNPMEATIRCSPYMAVLSSDGLFPQMDSFLRWTSSGIAAWTMLLLSTLNPGCANWTVEQAAQHLKWKIEQSVSTTPSLSLIIPLPRNGPGTCLGATQPMQSRQPGMYAAIPIQLMQFMQSRPGCCACHDPMAEYRKLCYANDMTPVTLLLGKTGAVWLARKKSDGLRGSR